MVGGHWSVCDVTCCIDHCTTTNDHRPSIIFHCRVLIMSIPSHTESFVLFELAGNTCGVRSLAVQSVEMVEHVTAVPNALPFVEGLTFTHGQVIPRINLRIRLGSPKIPVDPRARTLVVRLKDRTVGMLVDSAREFIS